MNYPVDINKRFTIYNKETQKICLNSKGRELRHQQWPRLDGMPVSDLDPVLVYLEEIPDYFPEIANTQVHRRDGEVIDLENETIQVVYRAENLPQEELANDSYFSNLNAGFTTPQGFVLGLQENDRNSFSQMISLVQLALNAGLITGDSLQKISDKNGVLHEVTTNEFLQIMLAYGFYYKQLWDQYKA